MSVNSLMLDAIDPTGSNRSKENTLMEIQPITMEFDEEEYVFFLLAPGMNSDG